MENLRQARLSRGWSQKEAARRLGVSQAYVAMLESGLRRLTPALARKAMRVYGLSPTVLPAAEPFRLAQSVSAQGLAEQLAVLGYPGFAYLRPHVAKKNPGEVLLAALAQDELEARLVEALPWLLLRYWDVDVNWVVEQAKRRDLQNRLGFLAGLTRRLSEAAGAPNQNRNRALAELEAALEKSRLAQEGTFCKTPGTDTEREWLRENRPEEAKHWNLLTDWRAEHLRYVA